MYSLSEQFLIAVIVLVLHTGRERDSSGPRSM